MKKQHQYTYYTFILFKNIYVILYFLCSETVFNSPGLGEQSHPKPKQQVKGKMFWIEPILNIFFKKSLK